MYYYLPSQPFLGSAPTTAPTVPATSTPSPSPFASPSGADLNNLAKSVEVAATRKQQQQQQQPPSQKATTADMDRYASGSHLFFLLSSSLSLLLSFAWSLMSPLLLYSFQTIHATRYTCTKEKRATTTKTTTPTSTATTSRLCCCSTTSAHS